VGWLAPFIAGGVLLVAMFACVGLLAIHRFQVVAIVVLVASGIVLAVWGGGVCAQVRP
jgi:hypothetical protein